MSNNKSHMQMLREMLDIANVELEKDNNKFDYIATVDTVLPSVYEADTLTTWKTFMTPSKPARLDKKCMI